MNAITTHPASPAPGASTYPAQWGRTVRVVSIVVTILIITVFAAGFPTVSMHQRTPPPYWLWPLLPLTLVGAALSAIRAYRLAGDTLLIDRLLWTTRLPLAGLLTATVEPNALRASIRTCGNGGLFCFAGWFWSRRLGHFRAFVTDLRGTVVLRYANRTVVVSPGRPEEFAREAVQQARRG